jgi:hypothetical protein
MTTGLELYEALKPTIGEDAARMIAEALPMTDKVATKADVAAVRADIDALRRDAVTKADLHAMEARTFRWMLGFFATLWLGNAGLIVTIVLKS